MILYLVYFILIVALCCFFPTSIEFNIVKKIKSIFTSPTIAQKLMIQLQQLQSSPNINLKELDLVEFKFYSDLVKSMISFSRLYGNPLKKPLKELVSALNKEIKFTKRLKGIVLSSMMQYLIIALMTWLFIFLLENMVDIKIGIMIKSLVLLLEVLGMIVFSLLLFYTYNKTLTDYDRAFYTIYTIKGLNQVGLPISKILDLAKFESFPSSRNFRFMNEGLSQIIRNTIELGSPISSNIQEMLDDLWPSLSDSFDKFHGVLSVVKFTCMIIFFLPSYFIVIFDLINRLGI